MVKLPSSGIWTHRHLFTPRLVLTVLYMSLASFNFGYDTSLFSGIQGMQSFTRQFGVYNPQTQLYTLPTYLSSVMNSTPFAGKLVGTLVAGPLMKKYGRKAAVMLIAVGSIIGVILQCSTTTAAQYTVGRILCYMMTGVTIAVVPTYQSESAPPTLRGAIVSTLQFWIGVGQLLGAVVTYATQKRTDKWAWLIPTILQFVVPIIMLIGYWWIPESPRWLIWNDRRAEAVQSLKFLRPHTVAEDALNYELDLILEADLSHEKGSFWELFKGTDKRRTLISVGVMIGQQITGQAFISQYQIVFMQSQNITNPSPFIIGIIGTSTSLVALIIVSFIIDYFGRRPILAVGGFLMGVWMFVVGGLGSVGESHPLNQVQKNVLITAIMLYGKSFGMSWAPLAYVVMSEIPTNRLREHTVLLATSLSVVFAFLVSFTVPYLLNPGYANLGAKVGYIYGSLCMATVTWGVLFVPETKNRSLEELDEMFANNVSVFKFNKYVSHGVGKMISELEAERTVKSKDISEVEHV